MTPSTTPTASLYRDTFANRHTKHLRNGKRKPNSITDALFDAHSDCDDDCDPHIFSGVDAQPDAYAIK